MSKRGNGEGSIYQMADGRWRAAVSVGFKNGKPSRKVFTAETRREVQEKLAKAVRDVQLGLPVVAERMTVGDHLAHWLEHTVKSSTRPKTYFSYEQMVRNHLVPQLGKKPLQKLTVQDVQRFITERLAAGCSPGLVKYLRVVLRVALNDALRTGSLQRNVASLAKPPRAPRSEMVTFDLEQSKTFLAAVQGHRYEALFAVALAVGLRHGEALALKDEEVDLEAGTLKVFHTLQRIDGKLQRVETKSEKGRRTVPIPPRCVESLKWHYKRRADQRQLAGSSWKETGYLFTSTIGTPLSDRNVLREFDALLKAAKLPKIRIHDLRHACVTLLAAQGVPLKTIADLVGHSDIRLTQNVYQHAFLDAKRDAVTKMSDALAGISRVATPVATKPEIRKPN